MRGKHNTNALKGVAYGLVCLLVLIVVSTTSIHRAQTSRLHVSQPSSSGMAAASDSSTEVASGKSHNQQTSAALPSTGAGTSSHPSASSKSLPTIFVIMASYRDAECRKTLEDLYLKAEYPQRVFVGTTEQRQNMSEACKMGDSFPFSNQINMVHLPMTIQEGHIWSHYLCSKLYHGQDYLLQIDAHTMFIPNWDSILINMLRACPSPKPVLTHYPHDYSRYNDTSLDSIPVQCDGSFDEKDLFGFETQVTPITKAALHPVPFAAGGFMFTLGQLLADIPYDPNLPFLWRGEEFLYAVRMWTSGYDFFTPDRNVVFHQYVKPGGESVTGKGSRPMVWSDVPNYSVRQSESIAKYFYILGIHDVPALYPNAEQLLTFGLGKQRSLQQYLDFAGLNLKTKENHAHKKHCPKLDK
eukprot:jgi/Chrzof1/4138/Cz14g00160.t1